MNSKIISLGGKEKLIFLYKLIEGISAKSFAINVAQIAGLPEFIINKSKEYLNEFK